MTTATATAYAAVTVEDLARKLNVTTRTIFRALENRDLPPRVKVPGMTPYWPAACINRWLLERGICEISGDYA